MTLDGSRGAAGSLALRDIPIPDYCDVVIVPTRGVDGDFGVQRFAQQGTRQRGVHADPVFFVVGLVGTNNADAHLFAVIIFQRHPGAEKDPVAVVRQAVDHGQGVQPLL